MAGKFPNLHVLSNEVSHEKSKQQTEKAAFSASQRACILSVAMRMNVGTSDWSTSEVCTQNSGLIWED